jgi:hypothetical protein
MILDTLGSAASSERAFLAEDADDDNNDIRVRAACHFLV